MSLAIAIARSIAALSPEITTCDGSLSLATVQTSPLRRRVGDLLRKREIGAEQRGHRALADRHRLLHRLAAQLQQLRGGREIERARGAQAPNIRRGCGRRRSSPLRPARRPSVRNTAIECAMIAGCAFSVSFSSSSGPSRISRNRFWPSASSTSSNTSRAARLASGQRRAHADRLAALPRKDECAHRVPSKLARRRLAARRGPGQATVGTRQRPVFGDIRNRRADMIRKLIFAAACLLRRPLSVAPA